jgi:hypothetical protein
MRAKTEARTAYIVDKQPISANPYPVGTVNHKYWRAAWLKTHRECRDIYGVYQPQGRDT